MGKLGGMGRKSQLIKNGGFTLIETVMTVAITVMIGLFLTGLISTHLKMYLRYNEMLSAKMMCSQAYGRIEEELRYAGFYYVDPKDSGSLRYYVRPETPLEIRDRFGNLKLPPLSSWPSLEAEDLENTGRDGKRLELDFTGTSLDEAHVCMTVVAADRVEGEPSDGEPSERVLYRQNVVITSLYRSENGDETEEMTDNGN